MKRALFALLLVCLLAAPAAAIVDIGDPVVTRLWVEGDEGRQFHCTATYLRPVEGVVWLLTAGHCLRASYAARSSSVNVLGAVDFRFVVQSHAYAKNLYDFALATVPETREVKDQKAAFLADAFPKEEGTRLYVHGFPLGIETVVMGVSGTEDVSRPGLWRMYVRPGDILPGSSGSAVRDGNGFIVGVVWGIEVDPATRRPTGIVLVTPIEVIHRALKFIEAQF